MAADSPGQEPIEALRTALARHPHARVSAVAPNGVSVPVPDSVPLLTTHVRGGTAGVKIFVAEDRPGVIAAFEMARRNGIGRTKARLDADASVVINVTMYNVMDAYGVILNVVTPLNKGATTVVPAFSQLDSEPPRLARIRKSDLAEIIDVDEATTTILGFSREEMVGRRSLEFVHPDDHGLAIENWMELRTNPEVVRRIRLRHRARDGRWIWFEMTQTNQLEGAEGCVVAELVDISKEMAAQEALAAREELLARLTQALPVGVFQVEMDGQIVYTNDRLYEVLGGAIGDTVREQFALLEPADAERLFNALHQVLDNGRDQDLEVTLRLPDASAGGVRLCQLSLRALTSGGRITGAIGCVADVTESALLRRELEDRATFDMLTRCHNRGAIMAALEEALGARAENGSGVAVVFVDLDLFKAVNDKLGHAAGDELLAAAAARLRGSLRDETDRVGRLGGDEFLAVFSQVSSEAEAARIGQRIASLLHHQMALAAGTVPLSASVGVAWSDDLTEDADALVARADQAMYESKRARQGRAVLAPARSASPASGLVPAQATGEESAHSAGAESAR